MVSRPLLRSFLALWMVTGLILLTASAVTVLQAWPGSPHANAHLVLLGGIEVVAALLFVSPRTTRIGAVGLLATIGVAFVVHTARGEFRGDLVVYGVAIVFVMVHGPLTDSQWRATLSRSAV
jgi:uncharacterized membrane protein YphA (DoxX/SURF4 family)